MKVYINIIITLCLASSLLFGAKSLNTKTKSSDKTKSSQLDKVNVNKDKPYNEDLVTKPMKKRSRRPVEVQNELELLKKKFDAEKRSINENYKKDMKILKERKRQALSDLKIEYKKKRARLRKR